MAFIQRLGSDVNLTIDCLSSWQRSREQGVELLKGILNGTIHTRGGNEIRNCRVRELRVGENGRKEGQRGHFLYRGETVC